MPVLFPLAGVPLRELVHILVDLVEGLLDLVEAMVHLCGVGPLGGFLLILLLVPGELVRDIGDPLSQSLDLSRRLRPPTR
jgi:hypothetical protein